MIRISDNGFGIPKEDQPKVFDAFFKAGNASNIPGTGLGLHIVDRFVKRLMGIIHHQSRLSGGSTFTLVFNL